MFKNLANHPQSCCWINNRRVTKTSEANECRRNCYGPGFAETETARQKNFGGNV
ncbi:MAG: hypothetical protein QOD06_255 [Candidatus Binatota bacterium]|nr:hypothetical protein [Candidatus Binatota bacterium]